MNKPKDTAASDDLLYRLLKRSQSPDPAPKSIQNDNKSDSIPVPIPLRAKPTLEGRLADYLGTQEPREITSKIYRFSSDSEPWTADTTNKKAVAAIALTVTCHLVHYAQSIMPENFFTQTRDELIQCFGASDAVKIEAEAYDLITWIAGAMDKSWKSKVPEPDEPSAGESSEATMIDILLRAIKNNYDLKMNYYTGNRGEFTERTITPVEITAEKHLNAFCHLRNDYRIFRLSRIVKLAPLDPDIPDADEYIFPKPLSETDSDSSDNSEENIKDNHHKMSTKPNKQTVSQIKNINPDAKKIKKPVQMALFQTPSSEQSDQKLKSDEKSDKQTTPIQKNLF